MSKKKSKEKKEDKPVVERKVSPIVKGAPKSIKIEADIHSRLLDVAKKTGMGSTRLASLLLGDVLDKVEKAGNLTVNFDGTIKLTPAAPAPVPRPAALDTDNDGNSVRKIDMRGMNAET